ncbi:MAG: hypothetical protein ACRDKT_05370 [Actinomycetota bacterium]
MGTPTKAVAALVFVAAIATLLAWPVLSTRDDPAAAGGRDVHASIDLATDSMRSFGIYPRRCLKPVPPPPGIGLIAAARERTISIGTPTVVTERFRGRAPISWSVGGAYLAWGRGQIYEVTPRRSIGGSVRLEEWMWSPIADCLVGRTHDDELVVRVPSRAMTRTLITASPTDRATAQLDSFEFSGDGRHLRVVFRRGQRWVIDLRTMDVVIRQRVGRRFEPPRPCARLPRLGGISCSPNGAFVVGEWNDRVYLARADGSERQRLAPGDFMEAFPEWGPPGTGVTFLRRDTPDLRGAVWFVPEGGAARPSPFAIGGEGFGYDTYPWFGVVDWNVSPPYVRCGFGSACFPT